MAGMFQNPVKKRKFTLHRSIYLAACLLALLLIASSSPAAEVSGVSLPDTLKAGDTTLQYNGGGVRRKYFMDMYVCGLYLKEKSSNALQIARADEPMAIRLQIVSKLITSDRMEEATREGFENSTDGNTEPIQKEIDEFINVFRTAISDRDIYDIVYVPGVGTEVIKNGKSQSVTKGLPLKRALFGIWLGEKPVQEDLKEAMLGK